MLGAARTRRWRRRRRIAAPSVFAATVSAPSVITIALVIAALVVAAAIAFALVVAAAIALALVVTAAIALTPVDRSIARIALAIVATRSVATLVVTSVRSGTTFALFPVRPAPVVLRGADVALLFVAGIPLVVAFAFGLFVSSIDAATAIAPIRCGHGPPVVARLSGSVVTLLAVAPISAAAFVTLVDGAFVTLVDGAVVALRVDGSPIIALVVAAAGV